MTLELNEKIKSHLTAFRMQLKTVSPVFIGGGEEADLNKTQYFFDKANKTVKILDEKKWAEFLTGNRLLDWYGHFIKNSSDSLYEWFRNKLKEIRKEHLIPDMEKCVRYVLPAPEMDRPHDLKCFIKTTNLKPYIPGSSIKGALRTALLFHMLRKGVEISDQNEEMKRVFGALQVGDSQPIDPENLVVIKKIDLCYKKLKIGVKDCYNHLSVYREYLKPGTKADFNITIDTNILKTASPDKYMSSADEILKALKDFSDFLKDTETDRFSGIPEFRDIKTLPEDANICMGGGAGFLSKTVNHATDPARAERTIRVIFIKRYNKSKFGNHDNDRFSPRTLKIAEYGGIKHLVGWCNLKKVEQIC